MTGTVPIGTVLNAAGILLGGVLGLTLKKPLSAPRQTALKGLLGVATVYAGLRLTLISLGPGWGPAFQQLLIVVLALIAGRLTGRLLRLQKLFNRLGRYANEKYSQAGPARPNRLSEGFVTCTVLFCAGPLAIPGAIQDGLGGHWPALGLKALMDGLATMAFVPVFGWGVILSVVPVLAWQGLLTLGAAALAGVLGGPLINSINATGGLLVFCVALMIFEFKKIELADYLPSLAFAPLWTWLWP